MAVEDDFVVLVTMDTSLPHQRNVDSLSLGIVVLDVHPATPRFLKQRMDRLIDACSWATSNQEVIVLE